MTDAKKLTRQASLVELIWMEASDASSLVKRETRR